MEIAIQNCLLQFTHRASFEYKSHMGLPKECDDLWVVLYKNSNLMKSP